ncbi:hypothetical protein CFIMG_003083RA [Ceratocystis fimbriata CBS 114723]|uniref:DNA-directed RNA polymerase III subunit rpc4 n=1 Tax=Ceratocystis fimbriata CBS 114723 TaxID=1035309 RepID=A0A2C5X3T7_9PEZI|nr:hypothetical protein CFIMG_003083RA [Ceratocystis fimbriata CBS 114723]
MNRGTAPTGRGGRAGYGRGASLIARSAAPSAEGGSSADGATLPSGSSMPIIKTEPGVSSTTTPVSRGAWGGRYKPKNARRSEAERAAIAEQEAQKQRERAAEEAKARPRGRFRGGRSRGNAMGQRGRPGNLAGMFGQRGGFDARGRGRGGAESKMSRENAARPENREPRINADRLGVPAGADNSDMEDEYDFYDEEDKFPGLAPMGIYRTKPKKETVTVTTAAEMEAQEIKNAESSDEEIDFKAAISNAKAAIPPEVPVKDVGSNEINFDSGRKKVEDGDTEVDTDVDPIAKNTNKAKPKSKLPVDPEEEQLEADLRLMRNEFSYIKIRDEYEDENDEETNEEKIAEKGIAREGRVYLFQFPLVMPPLRPVKKVRIKPESDGMFVESPTSEPIEVSSASPEGEDDNASDAEANTATIDNQSGFVGQMVVRKSGRVEMNWGGITYEMRPALKRDFVTSAVLVEYSDEKRHGSGPGRAPDEASQNDGTAMGLGKVMGQFILAPKYEDKSEWMISEEDLLAPTE